MLLGDALEEGKSGREKVPRKLKNKMLVSWDKVVGVQMRTEEICEGMHFEPINQR